MGIISKILDEIKNDEERYIKISLDLASQIEAFLLEMNWSQADLARKLNKKESEISKWLSGTHNFTVKTLALIESAFNKDLFIIPLDLNKNINIDFVNFDDISGYTLPNLISGDVFLNNWNRHVQQDETHGAVKIFLFSDPQHKSNSKWLEKDVL